jgi:hypothetical protein
MAGERVLELFEARAWDLGLFGWLFGYKRRLVLTTQRLFHFDKRLFANHLSVAWLKEAKAVFVGQEVNAIQFGVGFGLGGLILVWRLIGIISGPAFTRTASRATTLFQQLLSLTLLAAAVGLVILAKRKVLTLSVGNDKIGLRFHRLDPLESQRFVDRISAAVAGEGS